MDMSHIWRFFLTGVMEDFLESKRKEGDGLSHGFGNI